MTAETARTDDASRPSAEPSAATGIEPGEPFWYKDAILYELHVRAYADSDADGIGDLRGLISKLDYLTDLGVTAIWLLPFYPSPLKDDGYDIAEYKQVHPTYGSLRDVRALLREAHHRGLRVITELVMNHTSDQHPWFRRARRAKPGSVARDFYVWSDTYDRYRDARIIFGDFEPSNWTWDAVANAYYWHRFYAHQPDLNFDNPEVRRAMLQVVDFWFELGVDGMRLDAVPYLFEREGTSCENLPETHAFLAELRRHVDERFPDRMLLAEANQWPEDAVAYFGEGDECHMAFHFPLMPRMFMAIRMEDRFPMIDILDQTPSIPETCAWALFLRNHDELTLEMVTDEERDYMYRMYAGDPQARLNLGIRHRLAPLLSNNRRMIEMMNGLLFSLPGTPVIYYGDEIGMGDNIYLGDRDGVRTPMQWSADRNAGFSMANPQKLYQPVIIDPEYHASSLNVEAQQANPDSLLWWMKRLIALRKRYAAFGRGSLELLYPENRKVLAFLRTLGEQRILVVANLSRFSQYVELDLSEYRGMVPVELFGQTEFPTIGELTYLLTLGPHAFYWFSLEPQSDGQAEPWSSESSLPSLTVHGSWEALLARKARGALEDRLPAYLRARRWFRGKARKIRSTRIVESTEVPGGGPAIDGAATGAYLTLVQVEYSEGDAETYLLPLAARPLEGWSFEEPPHPAIAVLRTADGDRLLFDAVYEPAFCRKLLEAIARRRQLGGPSGKVLASRTPVLRRALEGLSGELPQPSIAQAEQTNTSIVFGDRVILKLFRRVEEGTNPDLEVGRFLAERHSFSRVAPLAGALEYRSGRREPATLAILHGFVQNEGDAWAFTVDAVGRFLEVALARPPEDLPPLVDGVPLLDLSGQEPPTVLGEMIGSYLETSRVLGERTAELHLALAGARDDPAFAPEAFSTLYQRALYQSFRAQTATVWQLARRRVQAHPDLESIVGLEPEIQRRFRRLLEHKISAERIRCHGDFHLGQVLYTGRDFVVIDFEGEPAHPLSERRIKRSPLRDVAGMLRSFHYAAYAGLFGMGGARPEEPAALEPWIRLWYLWVSAAFLRSYLEAADGASFLPSAREDLGLLLDVFLLEKAVYEIGYELNNRPEWLGIPVRGVLELLGPSR